VCDLFIDDVTVVIVADEKTMFSLVLSVQNIDAVIHAEEHILIVFESYLRIPSLDF